MLEPEHEVTWRPNAGPQSKFLASNAFEALYGGAAGGGKSDALLMGALRYVHVSSYRALLLRRTFPELLRSLIPKSFTRYLAIGGRPVMSSQPHWTFPSGAVIEFGHLQHDHDVHKYQSAEYQYIGFDELTSFTEKQYGYMLSRLRTTANIPCRVRSGTNPGGEGHEWVFKRWSPWLDPQSDVKAIPGQKLRYVNGVDGPQWSDVGVLSRVFYPARVADNPHLNAGYEEVLRGMDRVSRAQLLEGDWLSRPGAGAYYQRGWFRWLDTRPLGSICRVRRWDLASTEDGDWTIGARMSLMRDRSVVIEDVVRKRLRPAGVEACVLATAELDGKDVHVVIPEDPGQAGKAQVASYTKMLAGYVVSSVRETGEKVTRQGPFSAQCEAGNVSLVRGAWNEPFLQSLEAFPDPTVHDDDIDAAAGAFTYLAEKLPNLNYLKAMQNLAGESR